MKRIELWKVTKLILIILGIVFMAGNLAASEEGQAKTKADSLRRETYKPFRPQDPHKTVMEFGVGKIEKIRLNANGTPSIIYGDLNKGITADDPLEKCYQFFELHKRLFGMVNPREELVRYRNISRTIKFYQAHNGVKVYVGQYFVHFNRDWSVNGVDGVFYPEARTVDTTPKISKEQAIQIGMANTKPLGPNAPDSARQAHVGEVELLIARFNGKFHLVWHFGIGYSPLWGGESWYFFIDAKTGKILKKESDLTTILPVR